MKGVFMGTAALALGIISLALSLIPVIDFVGILTSIAAIVLGVLGRKIPAYERNATIGFICGVIALVLSVLGFTVCTGPVCAIAMDALR